MEDTTGPPWGYLAVEQYFITNWNWSSDEAPNQQRKRLVEEFLNLNHIPLQWLEGQYEDPNFREPTPLEIEVVLQPYRVDLLRWRASNMFYDHSSPAVLRTHYSAQESQRAYQDEMMNEWVDSDTFDGETWWAVLDDAEHFNFGSNWRRVYEILPEVAGPISPEVDDDMNALRRSDTEYLDTKLRPDFKAQIAKAKKENPTEWSDKRDTVIETLAMGLHWVSTSTYLLIADEEAFYANKLRLVYLDGFRNIVREGRLDPEIDPIWGVANNWRNCELIETTLVGDKYRVNGELGKELYQLTEEDLADPKKAD